MELIKTIEGSKKPMNFFSTDFLNVDYFSNDIILVEIVNYRCIHQNCHIDVYDDRVTERYRVRKISLDDRLRNHQFSFSCAEHIRGVFNVGAIEGIFDVVNFYRIKLNLITL